MYIYIYIYGLGGLVVTHSAAGVMGPGFNSPVARAYLRVNSRASTLADHIVEDCHLTRLQGGLRALHSADEAAVVWLDKTSKR